MSEDKKTDRKADSSGTKLASAIIIGCAVVIGFWLLGPTVFNALIAACFQGERVIAVADVYAALGALFSGLAFVAVVISLIYQRKDIDLQQAALTAQIGEFEAQTILLKQQQAFQELQVRVASIPALLLSSSCSGRLTSHGSGYTYTGQKITIQNHGATIYDVRFFFGSRKERRYGVFATKQVIDFDFHIKNDNIEASLVLKYQTALAQEKEVKLSFGSSVADVPINHFQEDSAMEKLAVIIKYGVTIG